jgi:hypothetical protein
MLWVWPQFGGAPAQPAWRFVLSTARRLDVAHRQLERVRDAVDEATGMLQGATGTSPGSREALFSALGEAELFMVGLYRALRMAADIPDRFDAQIEVPKILEGSLKDVKELRDAFEHIDERSLEQSRRKPDPAAITLFEFQGFLFRERKLRYHQSSLGIDEEATSLIIATRDYVVKAWVELCARNQQPSEDEDSSS